MSAAIKELLALPLSQERGVFLTAHDLAEEVITAERIAFHRQLWRETLIAAQTEDGMLGSVDKGGRFSDREYTRDTTIAANHSLQIHRHHPDIPMLRAVKKSVLGRWKYQLPEGHVEHETAPFDPESEAYKRGFFQQNGKPDKMYNDQAVDDESHLLWTTALYLTPQEQESFIPIALKTLDHQTRKIDESGDFIRYHYRYVNGQIVGMTSQGWMDSAPTIQHEQNELNTVSHPSGINIPPDDNGIAILEAQVHAWKAFLVWSEILIRSNNPKEREKGVELYDRAKQLKKDVQGKFSRADGGGLVGFIDGREKQSATSNINQATALSITHKGEHIVELDEALAIGREILSPDYFDPRYGVRTFKRGHKIEGDNYHLGENGTVAVSWFKSNADAEEGLRVFAGTLLQAGAKTEAEEMLIGSSEVALATLRSGLNEQIGQREQFIVRKDGSINFYIDYSQNPPVKHPRFQTMSASALAAISYNPVLQQLIR